MSVASVTKAQLAALLDCSERTITELAGRGIVVRIDKGCYDAPESIRRTVRHLREVAAGRGGENQVLDLAAERARLAREQADAQEMKNAVSRGELLLREDVHVAVTESFARVRAKLLSLPSKVAPLVFGADSIAVAKDIITKGVHEALSELAATRIAGVPGASATRSERSKPES